MIQFNTFGDVVFRALLRPLVKIDLAAIKGEIGREAHVLFNVKIYETKTGRGIPRIPFICYVDGEKVYEGKVNDEGYAEFSLLFSTDKRYSVVVRVKYLERIFESNTVTINVYRFNIQCVETKNASVISDISITVSGKTFTSPTSILVPHIVEKVSIDVPSEINKLPHRYAYVNGVLTHYPYVISATSNKNVNIIYGYIPSTISMTIVERRIGFEAGYVKVRVILHDEYLVKAVPNWDVKLFVTAGLPPVEGNTGEAAVFDVELNLDDGSYTLQASCYTGVLDDRTIKSTSVSLRVCKIKYSNYLSGKEIALQGIKILGATIKQEIFYIPGVEGEEISIEVSTPYKLEYVIVNGEEYKTPIIAVTIPFSMIEVYYSKVVVPPPPPPPPGVPGKCTLMFDSVNVFDNRHIAGEIFVDRVSIGNTPTSITVDVGKGYVIEVKSLDPDFEFFRWSFKSTRNPTLLWVYGDWTGTTRRIIAYLKPKGTYPVRFGIQVVAAYPVPMDVWIDGKYVGKSYIELWITKCKSYTIRVPNEFYAGAAKYVFDYWVDNWSYKYRYENPVTIHVPLDAPPLDVYNITAHFKRVPE